MNCRKCGSLRVTRRRAGFFICQLCGVQPGRANYDRLGNIPPVKTEAPSAAASALPYDFAEPRRRLIAAYATPKELPNEH